MECLRAKCKYYGCENSRLHSCDWCTISMSCVLSGCPVERMIRYTQDRLDGLKSIKEYLKRLAENNSAK